MHIGGAFHSIRATQHLPIAACPAAGDLPWPDLAPHADALASFRARIAPLLANAGCADFPEVTSDEALFRWLEGWQFDEEKAATAFGNMLAWREATGADAMRARLVAAAATAATAGGGGADTSGGAAFVGGAASLEHLPHWDAVKRVYPERYFHGADRAGNPVMITLQPFIRNLPGLMASVSRARYDEFRLARVFPTHNVTENGRRSTEN